MTPQEQMMERITDGTGDFVSFNGESYFKKRIDLDKLAQVLVELEEKRAPVEHCGVEDCPECNKESFKSGYLTALDDMERRLADTKTVSFSRFIPEKVYEAIDDLRKKHKE